MTTLQFVAQLGRSGIRVWAEGEALRFSAPPQALTAEMRREIAARKPELMAFLRRAGSAPRVHVGRVARTGALPLSFAQARLWFLDQLEPGSAFYNLPAARRLRGPLDVRALERALGEVVRRHEALRTVFRGGEGDDPVQVALAAPEPYVIPTLDLRAGAPEAREGALARLATQDTERPFDLAEGPLFRVTLVRLADEDHALLLCMHHIVSDGWSMGVLFREVGALYAAFRRGEPSPLDELPVQYADYAVWQREHLRGDALEEQLAYWRERLAGAPTLLELPTDRPRPAVQGHRGALLNVMYGPALRDGLQALARREGATLYIVLLTAFQVLLSRYARQEDVVVGSPIAGRTRAEVEGLIGFFVNTLVIRTDLRGDPSFRALLARVREEVMGAYERQDVPFEKLVEELRPERSMSHSPLFQVMFALQNVAAGELELEGVEMGEVQGESHVAKFDLTVAVEEVDEGLRVWVEYDTDLFDAATIHRMLGHFRLLLEGVAGGADARISALPLLTAPERELLYGWNRTEAPYRREALIHQRFEEQAARTPSRTAVVFGEDELSYAALNGRANRLAHRLRAYGVGPGVPVGICLERTPDLVAGMLAVLKAGGVYLPLDPAYPSERLAFMVRDAGAPVLLTQERLAGRVSPAPERVVLVDGGAGEGAPADDRDPPPSAASADLAYLIYTSGSTGRPKGVQIEHRNAVAFLEWAAEVFPDEVLQGVLASTSVSFDLSVFEIFLPLGRGGCVILAENALQLGALPARGRVTLVNTVPSAGAELVRLGAIPPSVRVVNLAGEALPRELANALYAHTTAHSVYNLYGPSEDTTYSTFACMAAGEAGAPSIGRPISNTRVYLLDPGMALVPVGIPGELYLAGDGLARGYLGRPGLTAERFVPDPFSPAPGARLYRTGDLARWTPDGSLDYLGRIDHQVKVRGFRIELGEIESVLSTHPAVRDVVVLAREDVPGDRWLVAYVVWRQGAAGDPGALREHVRAALPEYMVPGAVVVLDRLPLTPNGKVDRRALPAPERGGSAAVYAPRTPVEEVLAGIWGEVLGVERVGARDDFFDLGGHSLIATRVLSRVRRVLGVELPLRTLFWHPTVEGLALEVERVQRGESGATLLPPVRPEPRDGPLPLSFGQGRLWFLDQLEPGSAFYNIPFPRRLHGSLDVGALERALGEVVRRHEALRTVFRVGGLGDPAQVILTAPEPYALPRLDLGGLAPEAREAALARLAEEDAVRPFDLAEGPLFRAALVRLADEDHALLLCMHHIVSDGWSTGVLYGELGALYAAYHAGRESPLPELPVQYADHAVWQHRHLRGEVLDAQLAFWKARLSGVPTLLELPTDRPRPAVQSHVGGIVHATLPPALRDALAALARREGATVYMVLLAAFQLLLSRYAQQEDVVVGSPIAGRTRAEVEGLIGFFVNTLVLRTDISGNPTFRGLLQRVRHTALEAYAHQDVPFEQLVQELRVPRSLSHSPLFQVMFGLQNVPDGDLEMAGLRAPVLPDTAATARFDLMVLVHDGAEGLSAYVEYAAALFDAATVARLMRHFEALLRAAVTTPDVPVGALSMLPEDERARVVQGWNATERFAADGVCVPHLFARRAALAPGAPALEFAGATLSYAQVDARSSRLARRLRAMGVGPDVRVAVSLERSVDMPVAVLAVLKAGGGYVAVDPGYPPDRVAYMLRDSRAAVLITTSGVAARLPREETPLLLLDTHARAIAAEADGPLPVQVDPQNLAYVLYTSGTTGRPKGAALPHRALVNLLHWQLARFGDGAAARTLQFASLSFDVSFQEIFSTWAAGGCLVLVDEETRRDTEALVGYLREHRIQRLFLPFAALQNLAETAEGARLPEMREIITAGEALRSTPQLLALYRANPGLRLDNHYGPSETHVVSAHLLADDAGAWPLLPPIGAPIDNVRLYVLDAWMRPAPIGVPGELYLGGAGVARGYLGRSALTAERFVPDPYDEPGARLYRSGDGARWLASGELEYLGRLDQQVKIRGFRIEPGEVEGVLATHPGVRQAVVVVREDVPGDRRLVAYVVSPEGVGAAELREHARTRLPDYMVPAAFVPLDAL
ncbi:MAG TPA: amino acid adenylation domain-containing protein, partial [Longimicrobium sp.]|uniref:amino acid adenylation domain-containing protein n=1 Tax=Longimicrobium sp. TaxID=2029185 RepID=UPI002ED8EF6D